MLGRDADIPFSYGMNESVSASVKTAWNVDLDLYSTKTPAIVFVIKIKPTVQLTLSLILNLVNVFAKSWIAWILTFLTMKSAIAHALLTVHLT